MTHRTDPSAVYRSRRVCVSLLLRRFGQAVFTVWLAVTVSFFALAAVPGDPISVRLGPLATISPEQKAEIRDSLGLNKPVFEQYLTHLANILRGDFGYSYQQHLSVPEVIGRQLAPTIELTVVAFTVAVLLVVCGQILVRAGTAWNSHKTFRHTLLAAVHAAAVSAPSYWIGFVLLWIFALQLHLFPAGGSGSFAAVILPSIALAIPVAGLLGQVLTAELDSVEATGFALTSRARGQSRAQFAARHGLRHALPGTATLATNIIGGLFGGAVLVETVFARPGLGAVTLSAVVQRDMPVVLGLVFFSALVFAFFGALLDALLYTFAARTAG